MTRFLVTGASGLLGLNFAMAVDGKKHQVIGVANTTPMTWVSFTSRQAELTEPGMTDRLIEEFKPDCILHCAAVANLEACEKDPGAAERINAILPGEISAAAAKHSIKMVQISTDAVFDGVKGNYVETDATHPLSIYARTKLEGENAALAANDRALVMRVNFYGWSAAGNRSLAEWFVHNFEAGNTIKGFTDVLFCPMMVLDLADLLVEAVEKDLKGLYHAVGPEAMSKYAFGCTIARKFGFDESLLKPASVKDSGLTAARSPNLTLSTEKLTAALGHPLPSFDSGLTKLFDQYRRGYPAYIQHLS